MSSRDKISIVREPPYREPPRDGSGSSALEPIEVHRDSTLVVTRRDCVDYGDRAEDGTYDYIYRFAQYGASTGAATYRARRYADEWSKVAIFLPPNLDSSIPYDDPAFARVANYFVALDDVQSVSVFLDSGYAAVDLAALRARMN